MITLKCKMCGGTLQLSENCSVIECDYCETRQTVPKLDDDKKAALFERANLYRSKNEFDNATLVYENILTDDPDESEAYWGICLCRYGIEYVEDPKTGKRVPTCHRAQFKSILDDSDYLAAIENADILAKEIYISEAKYIDKVQKDILAISSKEDPFDIFICYKETDENGNRTIDSVIAQDIYTELTQKGYKVFFSRITLEDKLGTAYEPYIFAALNSARIMLVVATNPEYFEAVWVKNEWSRYISLMEQGNKKTIIPCYRNMSINDMPNEFLALQALDVSKIGYMQDLLRGIDKILETPTSINNTNINAEKKTYEEQPLKSVINYVKSVGASHSKDNWPSGTFSSVLNKDVYPAVAFHMMLQQAYTKNATISLSFKIYDEMNNLICNSTDKLNVVPGNDKVSKVWILRGNDDSAVNDGQYKAVFSIDNSAPYEYSFKVTSGKSTSLGDKATAIISSLTNTKNSTPSKSIWVYLALCFFLGFFGAHSFYAGKKKKGITQLILTFILPPASGIWIIVDLITAFIQRKVPM